MRDWIRIATETGTPFACFHHHLQFMLEGVLSRPSMLREFECHALIAIAMSELKALTTTAATMDFIDTVLPAAE